MSKSQIYLALLAAAATINKMQSELQTKVDLQKVPAFYGIDFPTWLKSAAAEMEGIDSHTIATAKGFFGGE